MPLRSGKGQHYFAVYLEVIQKRGPGPTHTLCVKYVAVLSKNYKLRHYFRQHLKGYYKVPVFA